MFLISTESEYAAALARIEHLMNENGSSALEQIDALAAAIECWEHLSPEFSDFNQCHFNNIFDAVTDDPAEAEALRQRSNALLRIREIILERGWNPPTAVEKTGLTQSQLNTLLSGKVDQFKIDILRIIIAKLDIETDGQRC
ncbi:MAG: XRE family transcriptional regulator [Motiliproteus sp.]